MSKLQFLRGPFTYYVIKEEWEGLVEMLIFEYVREGKSKVA